MKLNEICTEIALKTTFKQNLLDINRKVEENDKASNK